MSTAADKSREERLAALRALTLDARQERHERVAAGIGAALDARRALATGYLRERRAAVDVPSDRAVAVAEMIDLTAAARDEAAGLAAGREAAVDNVALQFPVLSHHFRADGPVVALGTSEPVLSSVVDYFGMVPVLYNVFVTRAHNTEFKPNTAHRFHIDPEDVISLKVFVHLTEVDSDCGPLHVLPAARSREILEAVDYRGIDYLDDEQIDAMVGWDSVVEVTGPPGTVAFADTTRCLHFGGRPRAEGRPLREMIVFQYLLPTSTLMAGAGASPPQRFLPQLERRGDDLWDALIGAALPGWPASTVTVGT